MGFFLNIYIFLDIGDVDASHERFGQFAGGEVRCRNAISDVFIRNVHDSDETKS